MTERRTERILPVCRSHSHLNGDPFPCQRHPQWKAVACWRIAGIFHRTMCADCVEAARVARATADHEQR
jgi:hypothetical protein